MDAHPCRPAPIHSGQVRRPLPRLRETAAACVLWCLVLTIWLVPTESHGFGESLCHNAELSWFNCLGVTVTSMISNTRFSLSLFKLLTKNPADIKMSI